MILASFVQPLIVGPIYAFIPGFFAALLVVIITKMEDGISPKFRE